MDSGINLKYVEFVGGPKDGRIWQCLSPDPFISKVAYRPKHGKTRHVYECEHLLDDFYFYNYIGVQIRNKKMRWRYVS